MITPETQAWMAMMWRAGMSQKDIGRALGERSSSFVCLEIKDFCDTWTGVNVKNQMLYDKARKEIVADAILEYLKLYDTIPPGDCPPSSHYSSLMATALNEHAWMLRAEGMTLQAIGERLGVSSARARQRILQFGRRTQRALRKCRVKWELHDVP
jgi:hypothetical protein